MDSKIVSVSGKGIVINGDDIDTDRIIPARFLKEITFSNLGKYPFHDERFHDDMSKKNHPFNDPDRQGAKALFVNKNLVVDQVENTHLKPSSDGESTQLLENHSQKYSPQTASRSEFCGYSFRKRHERNSTALYG